MSIKNSTTGALAIAPPTPKASTISRYEILSDFVTLPPRNICTALNPCRTHSHRTSPRIARISLLEERGVSRPHRLCTAMHRHAPPCTAMHRHAPPLHVPAARACCTCLAPLIAEGITEIYPGNIRRHMAKKGDPSGFGRAETHEQFMRHRGPRRMPDGAQVLLTPAKPARHHR